MADAESAALPLQVAIVTLVASLLLIATLDLCPWPGGMPMRSPFPTLCTDHQPPTACYPTLALADRVKILSELMTPAEQRAAMGFWNPPVASLRESQAFVWWGEALHGLASSPSVRFSPLHRATSFPVPLVMASSFNATLWRRVAEVVSTEARAFWNERRAGLSFWTPNINVLRDPRWGRAAESPGEDPYLNGEYAVATVQGMQHLASAPWALKTAACCKHFAAYSIENWKGHSRHSFDAQVSDADLEETYLPAFEACVKRGGAACVMCAYNAINGVPACASPLLGKLRREWGFDGYITSDCGALGDAERDMGMNATRTKEAVLRAGVDLDCGAFFKDHLARGDDVGEHAERLLRVQVRLGLFDAAPRQAFAALDKLTIFRDAGTHAHSQLALEAALQGAVLLRNNLGALPLRLGNGAIALIGPFADARDALLGPYSGETARVQSLREAFAKRLGNASDELLRVAPGCDNVRCAQRGKRFDDALAAARGARTVVLLLGLDGSVEAEGLDRESLLLPGLQSDLARSAASVARGDLDGDNVRVVAVVFGGGPVDVSNLDVDAVLWAGHPGQRGAEAVAALLFGDANPSGALTQTWYPEAYVRAVNMTSMRMRANSATGFPGRGYRYYRGPVLFPFGHGLSYSQFSVRASARRRNEAEFEVTNLGPLSGAKAVVVLATDHAATGDKALVGFARTPVLAPRQSAVVTVRAVRDGLAGWDWAAVPSYVAAQGQ